MMLTKKTKVILVKKEDFNWMFFLTNHKLLVGAMICAVKKMVDL